MKKLISISLITILTSCSQVTSIIFNETSKKVNNSKLVSFGNLPINNDDILPDTFSTQS